MAAADHLSPGKFSLPLQTGRDLRYHMADHHGYGPDEIGMMNDPGVGTLHDSDHALPGVSHNHAWSRPVEGFTEANQL